MRIFPPDLIDTFSVFRSLHTPTSIQDFLDTIPINFEINGANSCCSPFSVLKKNEAHCIEGALLAAAALWYHGQKPLLLDLKTTNNDTDHVVALFKKDGYWGAISKTNHAVLRYRDPVYKTIRELAVSYFNEYFLDSGEKTMKSYSKPFSLLPYENEWLTSSKNLWGIHDDLDTSQHIPIISPLVRRHFRKVDPIEIEASSLVEWEISSNCLTKRKIVIKKVP